MENVEVGDIVGWFFSLFHDGENNAECHGEVVSIHGDYLGLRSLHITKPSLNPFHGLHRNECHMVQKKVS